MKIPSKLANPEFRFVLLKDKSKFAYEIGWTTTSNYPFDDPKLINHTGNYGVCGGYGNLVILDFDTKEMYDKYKGSLPSTFTVLSANRQLPHLYFITDAPVKSKKIAGLDIKGIGGQCVGPGSFSEESNREYTIANDVEIANINHSYLETLFSLQLAKDDALSVLQSEDSPIVKRIKREVDFMKLLKMYGGDTSRNPTMCPLGHDSEGKKCFHTSIRDGITVWKCFHCDNGGTCIDLVMQKEKLDFKNACQFLVDEFNIHITDEEVKTLDNLYTQFWNLYTLPKRKEDAIEMLVSWLVKNYHLKTIRSDTTEEIWMYQNGIYIPDGKTYIREITRFVLRKNYKNTITKTIIDKIIADTYVDKEEFFDYTNLEYIPVENGLLNINTREMVPFDPSLYFFAKITPRFNQKATCEHFQNFLKETLQDEGDIKVVQEFMGYCLFKEYKYQKAIMFTGAGGNGKSVLIKVIEKFLNAEKNGVSLSLSDLSNSRGHFMISKLAHKLINTNKDIGAEPLDDTTLFKLFTGNDSVTADRKFKDEIIFRNYAKMLFSANQIPETNDKSDGFFRRWIIIDFPYRFLPRTEYELNKNDPKVKLADPEISDKITSDTEMSGILNWALDGLQRLHTRKDFTHGASAEATRTLWSTKANSFYGFFAEKIEPRIGAFIDKSVMKQAYLKYCADNKIQPVSDKLIVDFLEKRGSYIKRRSEKIGDLEYSTVPTWMNLTFKIEEASL